MKKTLLLSLAAAIFLSYGCTHTSTFDTVKYHTEDKGTFVGRVLHLPVTAYRSVVKGFKTEEEIDADTLID